MKSRVFFLTCFALVAVGFAAPARAGVDRPPQFVLMAFDICTELERCKDLIDFAGEINAHGDRLHFTFFVSGINFLSVDHRNHYKGPHPRRG